MSGRIGDYRRKNKCILLYVSNVYPPFETIDFKIKNNTYMDGIIKALNHHIKTFYMTTAQTLLDDRSNPLKDKIELKILENTGLANELRLVIL